MPTPTISLFDDDSFSQPRAQREQRLLTEMQEMIRRHRVASPLFDRICEATGWKSDQPATALDQLPFLPAQYFKEAGERLVSVPKEQQIRSLSSSATSGRASTVVLDQSTARRQVRAVVNTLSQFIGPQRRPMLVCDVPPAAARSGEISARAAAMLGFMTFASSYRHVLNIEAGNRMAIDEAALERAHAQAIKDGKPVTVIAFTFLLYTALLETLDRAGRAFTLPPGSTILHIGGWKGLEDRKVDRMQLAATAERVFGIGIDRIVDCYGFTEQMGTLYLECSAGKKHAPAFADVIVRDPLTMAVLPDGQTGAGQFLSLVPESYPGNSILTDDLVCITGRESCSCGRLGTTFEVLGRHKSAEVRGCGDVLAEKIILQIPPAGDMKPASVGQSREPRGVSYFREGTAYRGFEGDRPLPRVTDWSALELRLRTAQRKLAKLSVDEIIGVLATACARWSEPNTPFAPFHPHGLSFVAGLTTSGAFQRMVDASLRGSRGYLDGFRPAPNGQSRLRANPLGIVTHWLAGNVPTLGFLSLMLSLAAKNANILKLPETVSPLLPEMLETIAKVRYRSASGNEIHGSVLTDCIEAVWYPHDAIDGAVLSQISDARVIWGGAEAVHAVAGLSRRHDCVDVVFGPKLSLAAVGREMMVDESTARRAARGIAIDCSVFDQEACASAHTVFVERGGAVGPEEFARLLAQQMEFANRRIPRLGITGQLAGAVKSARMQHFMDGQVFAPASLEWSVLYRDIDERPPPIYGRCALVRPTDDLSGLARHIDRNTQAVGLSLPGARRLAIAELIAEAGVDRITEPGAMAEFTTPWDGVFPLERLIRWVSLKN